MCRNIMTLQGLAPPATAEEIEAAARRYVRKVSDAQKTSASAETALEQAVVADAIAALPPRRTPPRRTPPRRTPPRTEPRLRRLASAAAGSAP